MIIDFFFILLFTIEIVQFINEQEKIFQRDIHHHSFIEREKI